MNRPVLSLTRRKKKTKTGEAPYLGHEEDPYRFEGAFIGKMWWGTESLGRKTLRDRGRK